MGVSFEQFANELKAFNGRRDVVNELRKELRKEVIPLRAAVRENATASLPSAGGLNRWVARAGITVRFRDSGRTAGLWLRLSRKAGDGDKADLKALDLTGAIRHPLYGNRRHWYGQRVAKGFFTNVWNAHAEEFIRAADRALDRALEVIRRG